MIPAPTTSRSASTPRPADLGWEPVPRDQEAEELKHPVLRVMAEFGCGIAAIPFILFALAFGPVGSILFLPLILVFVVPLAFAWWWANPGRYAVAYLMVWLPLAAVSLSVIGSALAFLLWVWAVFSLGLPLCVAAWMDWVRAVRHPPVLRVRSRRSLGDWRVVVSGTVLYVVGFSIAWGSLLSAVLSFPTGGYGPATVGCSAVLLLPVGIILAAVGFFLPDPRSRRPQVQPLGLGTPPPACPRCTAPLVWLPSEGRWACPRCGARF